MRCGHCGRVHADGKPCWLTVRPVGKCACGQPLDDHRPPDRPWRWRKNGDV